MGNEETVSGNSPGLGDTGTEGGNEGQETGNGEQKTEAPETGNEEQKTEAPETGSEVQFPLMPEPADPVIIEKPYIPEELTGSIEGLISFLQEERETEPVSTWEEGAAQWTVTFLGRTISVYSFDGTEETDTGHYCQASDGNWVAGSTNLPLYEEYLFYLSGEVSASGIRIFGSDGGYPEDFTQCSDGSYVLMDDSAAYEEWLLRKEQAAEEGLASQEHGAAVLEALDHINTSLEDIAPYLATVSGNSTDMLDSAAAYYETASLYHDRMLEAQAAGTAAELASGFFSGVSCGLLMALLAWKKMH